MTNTKRLILSATGLATAAGAGTLAYSYIDPKFRSIVEVHIPVTKPLYKAVLGDSSSSSLPFKEVPTISVADNKKPKTESSPPLREKPLEKKEIDIQITQVPDVEIIVPTPKVEPVPKSAASPSKAVVAPSEGIRDDEARQKQLNQIIITQKQLYDIEHAKDVEKAVQTERDAHLAVINRALAQLNGLETALKSRVAQDAENRRAKQMWLAVQNIVDSIEYGKKGSCCIEGRRLPLAKQIKSIAECAENDLFMRTLVAAMPKTSLVKGEYTKEDLKTRFNKVYRVGRRVANLDFNGGGLTAHLRSWLQSILTLPLDVKYSPSQKVDPSVMSNQQLLDMARYFMRRGDTLHAVRLLKFTQGPTRSIATDFINDARCHEEALLIVRLMLAHAAATSIRSTY